jgi:hypothetical protein
MLRTFVDNAAVQASTAVGNRSLFAVYQAPGKL